MFFLTVYFIADAVPLFQQCSVSHTLSFCLCCLALFPTSSIWYKNPGIHFHLIIDHNKLFRFTLSFRLEVAHNKSSLTTMLRAKVISYDKMLIFFFRTSSLMSVCQSSTRTWPTTAASPSSTRRLFWFVQNRWITRRHDPQHNGIQHNGLIADTQHRH